MNMVYVVVGNDERTDSSWIEMIFDNMLSAHEYREVLNAAKSSKHLNFDVEIWPVVSE